LREKPGEVVRRSRSTESPEGSRPGSRERRLFHDAAEDSRPTRGPAAWARREAELGYELAMGQGSTPPLSERLEEVNSASDPASAPASGRASLQREGEEATTAGTGVAGGGDAPQVELQVEGQFEYTVENKVEVQVDAPPEVDPAAARRLLSIQLTPRTARPARVATPRGLTPRYPPPFRGPNDPREAPLETEGLVREVAALVRGLDQGCLRDIARMNSVCKGWRECVHPPARTWLAHPDAVNAMCRLGNERASRGASGQGSCEDSGMDGTDSLVVTACADNIVRVWDVLAPCRSGDDEAGGVPSGGGGAGCHGVGLGRCLTSLGGHHRPVECVAHLPMGGDPAFQGGLEEQRYGGTIVTGGACGYLRLWDIETGQCTRGFEAHMDVGEGANERGGVKSVGTVGSGLVVTGGRLGGVNMWDPRAREPRILAEELPGHTRKSVSCVAGLPGAPGFGFVTGGFDGKIKVWDVRRMGEEKLVRTVSADRNRVTACTVIGGRVGGYLATGGREGVVRVWDMQGGGAREGERPEVAGERRPPFSHVTPDATLGLGSADHSLGWVCAKTVYCHGAGVSAIGDAANSQWFNLQPRDGDGGLLPGLPMPTLLVGGSRSGSVKLLDLNPPQTRNGGDPEGAQGAAESGAAAEAAEDPSQPLAARGRQAIAMLAARMRRQAAAPPKDDSACMGQLICASAAPRPVTNEWRPAFANEASSGGASVASLVGLGVHLDEDSQRVGPRTIAAAVRNDVCVWHMLRPQAL